MNKSKLVSLLLVAGAIGLWIYSLLTADFAIGYLGVIGSFPSTLYIGFGLLVMGMGVQWASKDCDYRLMGLGMLLMIAMLWLSVPLIGGSEPNTNHALRSLGLIEYIAQTGDVTGNTLAYLSWSGAYIVPALVVKLFGVNFEPIIGYAPFLMCLCYLPPLYVFLRNTIGNTKYVWMGIWVFYLANWLGDTYFLSASATGVLLVLILLALVTLPMLWDKTKRHLWVYVAIIAVFGLLAITHLLMSLVALCILGVVFLMKCRKGMAVALGICVALVLVWSFTGASRYMKFAVSDIGMLTSVDEVMTVNEVKAENGAIEITNPSSASSVNPSSAPSTMPSGEASLSVKEQDAIDNASIEVPATPMYATGKAVMVNPALMVKGQILTYISGNDSHRASATITALYAGFFVVLGVLGAVFGLWRKKSRSAAWLVLAMALAPLVLLVIPYGGRAIERLYMVELVFLAYFVSRLCDIKWKVAIPIFCAVLLLCFPAHMIAHYGNQSYDYVSEEHMVGLDEFHNIADVGYITSPLYPWLKQDLEKFYYIPFNMFSVKDGNIRCSVGVKDRDWWLIVTRMDDGFYSLISDTPDYIDNLEYTLSHLENVDLVYSNPDFRIYKFDMVAK